MGVWIQPHITSGAFREGVHPLRATINLFQHVIIYIAKIMGLLLVNVLNFLCF